MVIRNSITKPKLCTYVEDTRERPSPRTWYLKFLPRGGWEGLLKVNSKSYLQIRKEEDGKGAGERRAHEFRTQEVFLFYM